jgi:hypothetical protein
MASSISAGTTSSTALVATADTSGALVLQTNNGTTALTLSTAQNATFAGTLATASKGISAASLPAGSILQIVQTVKTDSFATAATVTDTPVTGLTVTITPTSSTSKILVIVNLSMISENTQGGAPKLTRGGTAIAGALAAAAGSRSLGSFGGGGYRGAGSGYLGMIFGQSLSYLDSPATTSATTYGVTVSSLSLGTYVNRSGADTDATDSLRTVSYITAMEIAA